MLKKETFTITGQCELIILLILYSNVYRVNTQRRHYKLLKEGKHSCMTDERIKMLQDLGFAWSTTGFNVKQGDSNDNNEPEAEKNSDEESIHSVGSNLKQETES